MDRLEINSCEVCEGRGWVKRSKGVAFSHKSWNAFGEEEQSRAPCPSLGGEEGEAAPAEKTSSAGCLQPVDAGGRSCMTHAGGGVVARCSVTSGECSCVQVWMTVMHGSEELNVGITKLVS